MKKQWRVLHIENSEQFSLTVRRALKKAGLAVRYERVAGPGALQAALASGPWDVVLSAFALPGLLIEETLGLVRASGFDPGVIILDGPIGEEAVARAMKAGAHDFVRRDDLPRLAAVMQAERRQAGLRRQKREAEEAFEVSERKYRVLFDCASDGMFITDFKGRMLDVNKITCVRLGYTRLEFLRKKITDFDLDETDGAMAERMERIKRLGHSIFERVHTAKNGTRFSVEVNARIIDYGGKKAILSSVRDVSLRRQAEEALRISQIQLSNAMKIARLGHWEYDVAQDLFYFNDNFYAIFRTTVEEAGGYTMRPETYAARYLHPDDRPIIAREMEKAFSTSDPNFSSELEHRIMYADGTVGQIAVRWFVVKDERGRTIKTYGVNQDITERKRAESALRESEERYRLLVENALVGIGISSGNEVVFANQALLEIFGYASLEEFKSVPLLNHVAPVSVQVIRDRMEKVGRGEAVPPVFEYDILRRDGTVRTLLAASSHDEVGGKRLTYSIFQDITERKRAEAALRESEERLSVARTAARLGIYDYDAVTGTIHWDARMREIWGYPPALRITYHQLKRGLHPEDRGIGFQTLRQAFDPAGQGKYDAEFRVVNRVDGQVHWIAAAGQVYFSFGRARRLVGVVQDITERKLAEQALAGSEERLSIARAAADLGIYDYDAVTGSIHWDRRMRELWGFGPAERITYESFKAGLHPEDRDRVRAALRDVFDPSSGGKYEAEFRVVSRTDGLERWVEATGRVFFGNGRALRLVGVAQEITARKRAEEELRLLSLRHQAILSSVPDIVMEVNTEKRYTWANQAGLLFFGNDVIGREAAFYFEGEQSTYTKVQPLFEGDDNIIYIESWQRRQDGQKRLLAWWCRGLQDQHGRTIGALSTARDITERNRIEEELQWEAAVNSALAQLYAPLASPESTVADIAGGVLQQALALSGSEYAHVAVLDPAGGETAVYAFPALGDGRLPGFWKRMLDTRTPLVANDPSRRPVSGEAAGRRVLSVPVLLGKALVGQIALADSRLEYAERDLAAVGRLADFFALAVQSKRAEEQVKSSLKEKIILLKEIHHRIKNNLQVVMSLLNLQAFHLEDSKARALFRENQLRIKSMALIHERLYQSTDLSHVDFKEYITKLAVDLFRAYRIDTETVRLFVKADDVTLGIDSSVPCGLIINELLLNSLKHAFPRGRKGCVSVSLERFAVDQLLLTVADDGVGIGKNLDLYGSKSLGFNLVVALTEQLGGTIRLSREAGTKFEIMFRTKD